jgi:hypothetical protein
MLDGEKSCLEKSCLEKSCLEKSCLENVHATCVLVVHIISSVMHVVFILLPNIHGRFTFQSIHGNLHSLANLLWHSCTFDITVTVSMGKRMIIQQAPPRQAPPRHITPDPMRHTAINDWAVCVYTTQNQSGVTPESLDYALLAPH